MSMNDAIATVLFDSDQIAARIAELGRQITLDYADRSLTLVGVLRGAAFFLTDLARTIDLPLSLDFLAVSSYGNQTTSQGRVRIIKDLDDTVTDRDILIVEDIIDTGLTLSYLVDVLRQRKPASLRICALLDKPERRQRPVHADYTGFVIPDAFVVGYGLDYAQHYRNLPYIGILKPEAIRPEAT